jgi:hypothetical protein
MPEMPPIIISMELESTIQTMLSSLRAERPTAPKPLVLHPQRLAPEELAQALSAYGKIYGHSLMSVLDTLDRVSGHLPDLELALSGDYKIEWTPEEDDELRKGGDVLKLLRKWKGEESVRRRQAFLAV